MIARFMSFCKPGVTKSELALSHDEYSTDLCDKKELCDSSMFIPVPQLVKETDPFCFGTKDLC